MSSPVSPRTHVDGTIEKGFTTTNRVDSALSQHTIGGGLRVTPAKVKAWEISESANLVAASFNQSQPSSTSTEVQDYLALPHFSNKDTTHVFIVEQKHSRSTVHADVGDIRTVLDHVQPFPALNKTISAFKIDDSDCYIGKSDVHWRPAIENASLLEFCCLLKYAEQNNRQLPGKHSSFSETQRWSLRQMAIYQNFNRLTNKETIIIINNSKELFDNLKTFCRGSNPLKPYKTWTSLPLLIFSSLPAQWSSYIAVLHKAVEEQKKNATFTDPRKKRIDEADNKSLEMCVELMDRLHSAKHVLGNNITILESALREGERRRKFTDDSDMLLFKSGVEDTVQELQFHRNQIDLIIGRLDRTTTTISSLISLRSSYNMERMTERSILEAKAVRIIALLTLLFLPPTFISALIQMGGFDVSKSDSGRGHLVVDARPEFLFFLALAIPLMVVTVCGWLFWDWLTTRRRVRLEEPSLLYG